MGHNYRSMNFFCQELSLSPPTHALCRNDADVLVFSFAVRAHAQKFLDRFGGEFLDLEDRPKWHVPRTRQADISLEDRQRNGRCINCDD
jgi:hypothetical protein